jgi:hypothetical protein
VPCLKHEEKKVRKKKKMKKIMITAAIVCAAVFAQAATVSWGSGTYKLVDEAGETLTSVTGGSIVLAVIGDTEGFAKGEWAGTVKSVLDTATIGTGKKAGKIAQTYEFTYTGTGDAIKNGDVLAMIFMDDKGNYSQLALHGTEDLETTTFTIAGLDANDFAASPTLASGNFMAVPEPTSGLLMLVGLAGLALRRRRA